MALPLSAAAAEEGVSAERLSRLCSRALGLFEAALATLTRIGRPRRDVDARTQVAELGLTSALLEVATALLGHVLLRRRTVQELVVGAWQRLRDRHPTLTQERFCAALAIPARTLRDWLRRPPASPRPPSIAEPEPAPLPRKRPSRRPRFGFQMLLPGIQAAADTTGLSAFGVGMDLIALQDVGGRDTDLLEGIVVDRTENAERVEQLLLETMRDRPGMQLITDQGTPYMAKLTRDALDALEVEHAPQREGDPLGKATLERSFRTLKDIARPILSLTDRLAAAVPAFVQPELAVSAATLLVTALLRAYQAGARAAARSADTRGGVDPDELKARAEQSREQARAGDRSARLLLARIHDAYDIGRPLDRFIRAFRGYPLAVLHEAERRFGRQVHRDDIRDRASYFAAVVRRCHNEHRAARAREERDRETDERIERQRHKHRQQLAAWRDDPRRHLRDALDALAAQWSHATGALLFAGQGAALGWLRAALGRLVDLHGAVAARDVACALVATWRPPNDAPHAPPPGTARDAVVALAHDEINALPTAPATPGCAARFASAILGSTGPPLRPAPPEPLRT